LRKRDIRTLEDLDQILRPVFGDQVCYSVKFFRCHQEPDETFRAFSIRLATLAQRCGLQGKDLDAHMIDAFKNRTLPEIKNIMASLLPNTKPELAIQHGIWFEQNKTPSATKRKHESLNNLDSCADGDEPQDKKARQDAKNNNRQIHDKIKTLSDKFDALAAIRNNPKDPNPYHKRKQLVCFHCCKPNHQFRDCYSASEKDKAEIANRLKTKSFDFVAFNLRLEKQSQPVTLNSNNASMTSASPTC
jgi:hypothetical protein